MNFIFSQSLNARNVSNLVGISVECRRLDLLEASLRRTANSIEAVHTLLDLVSKYNYPPDIEASLYALSRRLLEEQNDWFGVFQCLLLQREFHSRRRFVPLPLAVHSFISSLAQSDLAAACQVCFLLYELNDHALLRLVIRDLASHDDASSPLAPILTPILRGEVSNRLYVPSTPPTLASTSSSCV